MEKHSCHITVSEPPPTPPPTPPHPTPHPPLPTPHPQPQPQPNTTQPTPPTYGASCVTVQRDTGNTATVSVWVRSHRGHFFSSHSGFLGLALQGGQGCCPLLRLFVPTRYATWRTMSTRPLSTQDVLFRRALLALPQPLEDALAEAELDDPDLLQSWIPWWNWIRVWLLVWPRRGEVTFRSNSVPLWTTRRS